MNYMRKRALGQPVEAGIAGPVHLLLCVHAVAAAVGEVGGGGG